MKKNNINLLDEITRLTNDTDMLKCITARLDDQINVKSINTLEDAAAYYSPRQFNYDLDILHSKILKISDDIININTQLDELYSDIQHIKDVLNI